MDKFEQNKLWNLWYHLSFHRYCATRNKWVVRDDDKCQACDGDKPLCFVVGGSHGESL